MNPTGDRKQQRLRDRMKKAHYYNHVSCRSNASLSLSSRQLYHGSRDGGGGGPRPSQNPRQESVFLVHRGSDAVRAGRGPDGTGSARRTLQKTRQWFSARPSRALCAFISACKSSAAWGRTGRESGNMYHLCLDLTAEIHVHLQTHTHSVWTDSQLRPCWGALLK